MSIRHPAISLSVELLEGRALLSGLASSPKHALSHVALQPKSILTDPGGVAAVLAALRGGPGSEFTSVIRAQIRNIRGVVASFVSGARTEFITPGLVFKIPKFQESYTGPRLDQLSGTVAGGLKLRDGTYEFAAIVRGPIDDPQPSTYVFGIDRGKGASTSTPFASRSNIKVDALVSVTRTATGVTGSVTDLTTNQTTSIDPANIDINGPSLRVYLAPSLLPAKGLATNAFRFSFWTKSNASGGIESVGSFVPESTMARITGVKSHRSA